MKLRIALAVLAVVVTSVVFADFLAPYDPTEQNRTIPLAYPAVPPVSHLRWFVAGAPYRLLGLFPCRVHLFGVDEPARIFLLGSDEFGRDQFSRLLHGGRVSLLAGLLAAALALCLGLLAGVAAGFYGGLVDDVVMRASELFLSLPWLYLLVGLRAFLPLSLRPASAFFLLIAVIGVVGWTRPGRLVRGIVVSAKEREYVYAARGFGASSLWLLRRHILPETWSALLVQASLLIPQFILAEVTMSFFGLGVGEPATSWGSLLAPLRRLDVVLTTWWMAIPAFLLLPIFLMFHLIADALQERGR